MRKDQYELDQVAIRMVRERPLLSPQPVNTPEAAIQLVSDLLKDYDREVFAIVNLRSDLCPINLNIVSMGALDASIVHPREVLKAAILSNANSVMLVHNHPSGQLQPSQEDIEITDRLVKAFDIMGISVVDHVIVGNDREYYSFYEQSTLPLPDRDKNIKIEEVAKGLGGMRKGTRESR